MSRILTTVLCVACSATVTEATSNTHFLPVSELVCGSDSVAVVQITGADTRFGKKWVYRADVSEAIRGETEGNTIYFAPPGDENYGDAFTYRLGTYYLVVLHESTASEIDPEGLLSPIDEVERGQYYEIGWGPTIVMPIEWRCDFDECTNEIAVSYVIKLPEELSSYASQEECGHDLAGAIWVRKNEFVSLLSVASRNCP